jgi:hypothetical protein
VQILYQSGLAGAQDSQNSANFDAASSFHPHFSRSSWRFGGSASSFFIVTIADDLYPQWRCARRCPDPLKRGGNGGVMLLVVRDPKSVLRTNVARLPAHTTTPGSFCRYEKENLIGR